MNRLVLIDGWICATCTVPQAHTAPTVHRVESRTHGAWSMDVDRDNSTRGETDDLIIRIRISAPIIAPSSLSSILPFLSSSYQTMLTFSTYTYPIPSQHYSR